MKSKKPVDRDEKAQINALVCTAMGLNTLKEGRAAYLAAGGRRKDWNIWVNKAYGDIGLVEAMGEEKLWF